MITHHRAATTLLAGAASVALLTGCASLTGASDSGSATDLDPINPSGGSEESSQTSSADDVANGTDWLVPLTRGGDFETTQDGLVVTIVCDGGGDVEIDGNSITATITGSCEDVDIDGAGNTVTIEITDDLEIDGNDNSVSVDTVRELDIDGNDNSVDARSITELDFEGSNNAVTHDGTAPRVEDEGTGNSVTER